MTRIRTRKQLRELADDRGIIKGTKPGYKSVSVRICPNGDILRNDVRLDLAIKMTVRDAVSVLGLQ